MVKPRVMAPAVSAARRPRQPGQGAHLPRGCDLANGVVAFVGDIDIAGCVRHGAVRQIKSRGNANSISAARTAWYSRQGAHHLMRADLPDRAVASVRHVKGTRRIEGQSARVVEPCGFALAVLASNGSRQAGQRGHLACRSDSADGAVGHINGA